MDAVQQKIIRQAGELFFQFGVSKVTMEEIADRLGMSKKTLYKSFASKDALLEATMSDFHRCTRTMFEPLLQMALAADNEQFLVLLARVGEAAASMITRTSSSPLFRDIERNYPHIWQEVESQRREKVSQSLRIILEQGIQRGLFRNDLNYEVFLHVYTSAIQEVLHPNTLTTLPLSAGDAYVMVIRIVFGGALTELGRDFASRITLNGHTVDSIRFHNIHSPLPTNGIHTNGNSFNGEQHNPNASSNGHNNTSECELNEAFWAHLVEVV